mmetsp:Transcript_8274/g.25826  ORF Transcript_8274/g.25826 Transcript_8274/m.25826 type:complete len:336 (+) Transcript_8274:488-1495(+)
MRVRGRRRRHQAIAERRLVIVAAAAAATAAATAAFGLLPRGARGEGIADVVLNGAREEDGLLADGGGDGVQLGVRHVADVSPVDAHAAAGCLVEVLEQVDDRRLSRAALPHQRHRLAREDGEREAAKHGRLGAGRVAEEDVAQLDEAARVAVHRALSATASPVAELPGSSGLTAAAAAAALVGVSVAWPALDVVEDLRGGARALEQRREGVEQVLRVLLQLALVEHKGEEHGVAQQAALDQEAAVGEQGGLDAGVDQEGVAHHVVDALHRRLSHDERVELFNLGLVARQLAPLARERAHRPNRADHLDGDRVCVGECGLHLLLVAMHESRVAAVD